MTTDTSSALSLRTFTVYGMVQNMEYTVQHHTSNIQYVQRRAKSNATTWWQLCMW